jgi:CPA1 family monovalent cation:H+ antiporter
MNVFQLTALLITLAALFSYVNQRLFKLPATIGLMLISLLFSLALICAGRFGLELETKAGQIIASIDFNQTLMQGMLSFLLFAGALHVNLDHLLQQKGTIGTFATLGVLTSTLLIAGAMFLALGWIGLPLPLQCSVY